MKTVFLSFYVIHLINVMKKFALNYTRWATSVARSDDSFTCEDDRVKFAMLDLELFFSTKFYMYLKKGVHINRQSRIRNINIYTIVEI